MTYDLNTTLKQIRQLDTTGNITPHSWYKAITFPNGKPDLLGIVILGEIVYWYRPTEIRDSATGKLLGYRKKFKGDMFQRNYASLGEQFGFTARQAMDAVKRLEEKGFLIKEVRKIQTEKTVLGNVLFLAPNVQKLLDLQTETTTFSSAENTPDEHPPYTFERTSSYDPAYKLLPSEVGAPTLKRRTYTENTTQITTEIKKTAAEKDQTSSIAAAEEKSKPLAVVALEKKLEAIKSQELPQMLIGKSLTYLQEIQVAKTAKEMVKHKRHGDAKELAEEIAFALLSSETFTQAGKDFFKKLNTIRKCIREGRWSKPAKLLEQASKKANSAQQNQKAMQQELEGECAHWKHVAEIFKARNNPEQMRLAIAEHKKALENLERFIQMQASAYTIKIKNENAYSSRRVQ